MPWFKVDDGFAFHPKAIAAGNAALGLWVRAGSWCGANLTGGALPRHMIGTLGAQRRDALKLVNAGLWCETEDGYQFNGWDEYQPSKAQVEADRKAGRERQARWRERHANAATNGVTETVTNGGSNAAPTRPDPTSSSSGTTSMPRKRGERLPEPWVIDEAMWDWAAEKAFAATFVNQQTERFVNYWRAKAGKDATKLDWRSTWKNWLLRAADDYRPTNGRTGQVDWDAAMARAQARDSQEGTA